jgi:hypothetical protein
MNANNRDNNRRWWVVLACAGLTGCSDGESSSIPQNQPVQMNARLQAFESCAALEAYIEDAAVLDMRTSLERSKPSYWDKNGGWYGIPRGGDVGGVPPPSPEASPSAPGAGAGAGDSAGGPSNHTGTNNQVAGVDEADFVKNDGTRLFVLSGQKLYAHRSWPAASLRAESSLTVEGWPRQMFLHGDKVVIFSGVNPSWAGQEDTPGAGCSLYGGCGYYGYDTFTKVTTVDVSQLAAPRVVSELYLPGSYQDARLSGGAARVVLQEGFNWPNGMRWYPDFQGNYTDSRKEELEKAIDVLIRDNERLLRARSLTDWLPEGRVRQADGSLATWQRSCQDFHRTNAPTRLGFATVASFDLDAAVAQAPGLTTLVAQTDIVYATASSLYLSARHWWWWVEAGQSDYSYVHKLDLTQPQKAHYVASGTLEGQPLNPFSFDEHEGILRVATTLTRRVEDSLWRWGRTETSSRVSTYALQNGQLALVGQSPELAEGERIYSARFLGTKGYLVTFRQVDPLFTFDLSDPAHPRKVGELKVPGFSAYIHPMDDTHLLTVGEDRAADGSWTSRALKLSLFDVSDLAHPREVATQRLGSTSSGSEALYDHKAFNYFAAKGLLAVPFMDWNWQSSNGNYWSSFTSDLRVFRVNATTGFSPVGTLDMSDLYRTVNYYQWSYTYTPTVRRSVMADDYVYAITDAGVRVSNVAQLSQPLVTTRFDPPTH